MELYLIRHGIAQDAKNEIADEERSLTKEGRQKTEKIAHKLSKLGLEFDVIATSPLLRARQTAEIFKAAELTKQIEECKHLAPSGHIYGWLVDWLLPKNYPQDIKIGLIGHQPDLGNWAESLVWGEAKQNIVLKKAGIIGLKMPEKGLPLGKSQMFWLTPPKFLL